MRWIKTAEQLPEEECWYWIYIPPKYVERAWYDPLNLRWAVAEGAYFHNLKEVTHWQKYFTPAPPIDCIMQNMKGEIFIEKSYE